jgi:hypothetical protein
MEVVMAHYGTISVNRLPTGTEKNCKNIKSVQPVYNQDSNFAPANFKRRELSLHHNVENLPQKPFWDTNTATMISSDRVDENWEDREVGKLARLWRPESLGGCGGRKFREVREIENFLTSGKSANLGGRKDRQDPLAGNKCIFET